MIAPVFFEESFLAQCFRKQRQIACNPSGLDGLVVANQGVERTVGKLRAVRRSKVCYSKTCRVGGRRLVQDGLRPLQRRHVQPLHGEDEVNLFP